MPLPLFTCAFSLQRHPLQLVLCVATSLLHSITQHSHSALWVTAGDSGRENSDDGQQRS